MIKIADIVYHSHHEYAHPAPLLRKHSPTLGFIPFLRNRTDYTVIRHLDYEGKENIDGVRYAFFRRPNTAWQIPFATHRYIKSLQPDIVLVHGFIFPIQVMALKLLLGKRCAIVLQHHAEQPVNSARKILQQMADRFVDAYMFTAAAIANPWLQQKIIHSKQKIAAVAGASASVAKKDRGVCKKKLLMTGTSNFLWAGRLNANKDPLTVLRAFARHVLINPAAMLYMIYQTDEMIEQVKKMMQENDGLRSHVHLIGKLPQTELADWYNAADFFITGSHAEAAGYALLEAMSVGCIPVVTAIPSFKQLLGDGQVGFLFTPGDEQGLATLLNGLCGTDTAPYSADTEAYFHKHLGFSSVADNMFSLFTQLRSIKG